jgi:AraC-like DNA-binding protein
MTDIELMRATLERLNLTYKVAAGITGMSEPTFKRYCTGVTKVKPHVWRALLEYEAKIHERQQDIAGRAIKQNTGH